MDVEGSLTSSEATMTVTDVVTGVPSSLFAGLDCQAWTKRVLCQVLSNAINVTLHSKGATPDADDFIFFAGDVFTVKPATNLRMVRNGTSACVKFQLIEG